MKFKILTLCLFSFIGLVTADLIPYSFSTVGADGIQTRTMLALSNNGIYTVFVKKGSKIERNLANNSSVSMHRMLLNGQQDAISGTATRLTGPDEDSALKTLREASADSTTNSWKLFITGSPRDYSTYTITPLRAT